jgi:hypothetical protein
MDWRIAGVQIGKKNRAWMCRARKGVSQARCRNALSRQPDAKRDATHTTTEGASFSFQGLRNGFLASSSLSDLSLGGLCWKSWCIEADQKSEDMPCESLSPPRTGSKGFKEGRWSEADVDGDELDEGDQSSGAAKGTGSTSIAAAGDGGECARAADV